MHPDKRSTMLATGKSEQDWFCTKPLLTLYLYFYSTKSLRLSLEASLKKLQTDYIDLLYVHWWDFTTSIPELMQSLNAVVNSGKVLYLGVSDTPAWVVSKANECQWQSSTLDGHTCKVH